MKIAGVSLGAAGLADVGELQALIQRAYRGETAAASWSHEGELPAGERVSCEALAKLMLDATSIVSLARIGERIVGTALVELVAPERCRIGLLSVEPDLQGQGIGDRLLENAEGDALDRFGARLAHVEVLDQKPKLIAYYERRGYRRTGLRRPYPHRLQNQPELLILAKRL